MVPAFLTLRQEAVYLGGAFEVLGPVRLLVPRFQRLTGWGLIALLVAVFPVNVNVAIHNLQIPCIPASPLEQWVRLPIQFLVIGLTWWTTQPERAVPGADRSTGGTEAPIGRTPEGSPTSRAA